MAISGFGMIIIASFSCTSTSIDITQFSTFNSHITYSRVMIGYISTKVSATI